jgi:hypothetical protein
MGVQFEKLVQFFELKRDNEYFKRHSFALLGGATICSFTKPLLDVGQK